MVSSVQMTQILIIVLIIALGTISYVQQQLNLLGVKNKQFAVKGRKITKENSAQMHLTVLQCATQMKFCVTEV